VSDTNEVRLARRQLRRMGETATVALIKGAATAAGSALVSLVVWWISRH
jgi:hypothetical protein